MKYLFTNKKNFIENKVQSNVGLNNQINRDNWLKKALKTIPANKRILDAGAGELKYKDLCAHLDYVSQDFAQYNGKGDSKGLQQGSWDQTKIDIISDITAIPLPDLSFDAIMCIEVFEHLPDPISAIREFSRLIKKGGTLIITAPFCSLTHFAPYHFYNGFNKYFYDKYLIEYNFKIEELEANGNYFEYIAQEFQERIPNQYTKETLKKAERKAIITILKMLKRMSDTDNGSNELLCYGYHVKAKKI